ncbi:hypothetical protein [Novacetimonas pomaceti]|uniref:hypothetical protein n=1 Tax=Novacetimonas pomaceti TaxID=2021998 RepID=UPI001C2D8C2A|nr:hypothetical protein [Novacetimonas pomaceti]MBV1832998.1 hypothetical protein [Novacetimonas pomaceti]
MAENRACFPLRDALIREGSGEKTLKLSENKLLIKTTKVFGCRLFQKGDVPVMLFENFRILSARLLNGLLFVSVF